MSCVTVDRLIQHLDGELSVNDARGLEEHLVGCAACRRRREELAALVRGLGPESREAQAEDLSGAVLARVRAGERVEGPELRARTAGARARRWIPVAVGGALALAAAALLALRLREPSPGLPGAGSGSFSVRGGGSLETERWLALWVYRRVEGTRRYAPVEGPIRSHERLVFGVRNGEGRYRHLMLVAVDATGQVYWYYPAYEHKGSDPTSIPLGRGRVELPAEIEHRLSPGRLRFFALFSVEPLKVSAVEAELRRARASRKDPTALTRLELPGVGQLTRVFEVQGAREGP